MKSLLVALILAGTWNYSYAQNFVFASDQKYPSPVFLQHVPYKISSSIPPRGLRMRNTGRALTIGGGVLIIGGIILMNNADQLYYTSASTQNGTVEEGDPKGALGLLMAITGAGMTVPGIIFWSKGQKKYNRYLEQQQVSLHSNASGFTLRYSF